MTNVDLSHVDHKSRNRKLGRNEHGSTLSLRRTGNWKSEFFGPKKAEHAPRLHRQHLNDAGGPSIAAPNPVRT